jgi:hypothetical protein
VSRSSRLLPLAGFVLALVGLALLVLQVVRTINGSALGTLGVVLLWVGVGLLAVAIILLTVSLLAPVGDSAADSAGDAAAEAEPAKP